MIPITKAAKGEDLLRKLIKNQVGKPAAYYVQQQIASHTASELSITTSGGSLAELWNVVNASLSFPLASMGRLFS